MPQPGLPQVAFSPHTLGRQGECEGSRKAKCRKCDCGCSPFPAVPAGIIISEHPCFCSLNFVVTVSDPVVFLLCTCLLGNVQLASQSSEMF